MSPRIGGPLVLLGLILSLLYLWQPWRSADEARLNLGLDLKGGLRVVLQANEASPSAEDLGTARNIIEHRTNAFGVAEPLIQTSGPNRIVVELPGLASEDQERALDLIGQQAMLEFRLVEPSAQGLNDAEITPEHLEPPAFTGEILSDAEAAFGQPGMGPVGGALVSFSIRKADASAFGDFTASNVGRRMAIVLDGTVISAPTIQSRIGTDGQISGLSGIEEASDLALVLRSGSLPISLSVVEIRAIGPTLGADSIRAGTVAGAIGGLAVALSVLLYYGPLFGGVLALGVLYAMLMILGVLAGLGATLTLPGLAGLVLTIGAAVDGNVISFERIKEELRAGRGLRVAMKSGFGHSLSAIIDANVTTLLAAAALYQYTSGPVRGFAITLAIGIVASMFVNTVVVPFALDALTTRIKHPRLPRGFYAFGLRFLRRAPAVMVVSAVLAVTSLLLVSIKGLPLSADFTSGTSALLRVVEGTSVDEVRTAIDSLALDGVTGSGATVQRVEGGDLLSVRVAANTPATGEAFAQRLSEALNARVEQSEFVGPAIGNDLRNGAWLAMAVAFGLISVYVGWRFWPNWIVAVASVLASLHDVIIVLGALALIGAEFSIPVLAALLFVVGYSLNDSIIIADRIRENLKKIRGRNYGDIVELSVNQTLSRTLMTSGTTLLPVLALFFFGGSVLRDFSLTLLIGIGFGTYSSIFILAPMVVWFKRWQRRSRPLTRRRVA